MTGAFNKKALLEMADGEELFFLQGFDKLPMGVMIVDCSGVPLYYNQAQVDIDGVEASEVLNRPIIETYGPASQGSSIMLYCLGDRKSVV